MQCSRCGCEAVIFQAYSGRHLCGRHLVRDIEARAKRSIRSHRWMRPGDHIAVPVCGDLKSSALLCFLNKLVAARRDIRLSAFIPPDTTGTGSGSVAMSISESLGIPVIEVPAPGGPATKIALAVSLDDLAEDVLGQFLFGNAEQIVNPFRSEWNKIPLICPFITLPSEELDLYWRIEGTDFELPPGRSFNYTLKIETRKMIEDFSRRHPATKYAVLHLAETLSNGKAGAIAGAAGTRYCSPAKALPGAGDRNGA
jgi:tRNA(Ile)-lysidine synthase TilS/MesJ